MPVTREVVVDWVVSPLKLSVSLVGGLTSVGGLFYALGVLQQQGGAAPLGIGVLGLTAVISLLACAKVCVRAQEEVWPDEE